LYNNAFIYKFQSCSGKKEPTLTASIASLTQNTEAVFMQLRSPDCQSLRIHKQNISEESFDHIYEANVWHLKFLTTCLYV